MSWHDFHRRSTAIAAVLAHARHTGQTTLPFHLPEVTTAFTSPEDLVQALHYKWSLLVTAHMDYDMFEEDKDPTFARRHAEEQAASEEPMLRELVTANESTGIVNALETQYLAMARRYRSATATPPPDLTRGGDTNVTGHVDRAISNSGDRAQGSSASRQSQIRTPCQPSQPRHAPF